MEYLKQKTKNKNGQHVTHGLSVRISYDLGTSICITFSSILVDATTRKDFSITKPFFPSDQIQNYFPGIHIYSTSLSGTIWCYMV